MSDHTTSQDAESTSGDPEILAVDETDSAAQRESLTLGHTAPAFLDTLSDGPRESFDETVTDESDADEEDAKASEAATKTDEPRVTPR